jgi:hypothetical protein
MDKAVRNLIQRATHDARWLLEAEFSEQLEGIHDLLPDSTIAEKPGGQIDEAQQFLRIKLIAGIEHKLAGGMPRS